jgi:hypothetical protein
MEDKIASLEAIKDIRSLMERSSRFISLSGLSGVFSGLFALVGAAAAYWRVNIAPWAIRDAHTQFGTGRIVKVDMDVAMFLGIDALLVLVLSIGTAWFFSRKKAKKKNLPFWNQHSKHLLFNLSTPLVAGGLFCVILFYHGLIWLIGPVTLIFYGLALLNAGKFTLEEISYLGLSEIIVGLLSLFFLGYGLIFWAIGFGLLHIVYGILMYWRHDR